MEEEDLREHLLQDHRAQASATVAPPPSPSNKHGGDPVETGKTLLRDHKAQASATPSPPGKKHDSDPVATQSGEVAAPNAKNPGQPPYSIKKTSPGSNNPFIAEDIELAALNAKNPDQPTNLSKKTSSHGKKSEEAPVQVRLRPLDADSLADAAEVFARGQRGREFILATEVFVGKARLFANNPDDPVAADDLVQAARLLGDAALSTPDPTDAFDIIRAAHFVLSVHQAPPPAWPCRATSSSDGNASIQSGAGSSMAAADAFCSSAEQLAFKKDRKSDGQSLLLSKTEKPKAFFSWRRQGSPTSGPEGPSFMQRLQVAISAPIHSAEEKALREGAAAFAKSAAGSSMAAAADAFCRAAQQFSPKKDRKKKVLDTELNKSAMNLQLIAHGAPSSEAALATIAIKLTNDAHSVLLSDSKSKPRLLFSCWKRESSAFSPQDVTRPSFMQRLKAAISAPEPTLPIHDAKQKTMVDRREVLYTLALGVPVAILTSAAGLHVFFDSWAWVAGTGLGVWILAASGMLLNQYAQLDWEWLAAGHLGRLGVLGAGLLFCFFTYRAFFPSASWALWVLLAIASVTLGFPWIMSCIREDDVSLGSASTRDAAGRTSEMEMRLGGPARRWSA